MHVVPGIEREVSLVGDASIAIAIRHEGVGELVDTERHDPAENDEQENRKVSVGQTRTPRHHSGGNRGSDERKEYRAGLGGSRTAHGDERRCRGDLASMSCAAAKATVTTTSPTKSAPTVATTVPTAANAIPADSSPSRYRTLIGSPHRRHRPRRAIQERIGMLSNHAIIAAHRGQCDRPPMDDPPSTRRRASTLRNDPMQVPSAAMNAIATIDTPAIYRQSGGDDRQSPPELRQSAGGAWATIGRARRN